MICRSKRSLEQSEIPIGTGEDRDRFEVLICRDELRLKTYTINREAPLRTTTKNKNPGNRGWCRPWSLLIQASYNPRRLKSP